VVIRTATRGLALAAALSAAGCLGGGEESGTDAAQDGAGSSFELGCRVEMVTDEAGARTLSVLEYDLEARLIRWRGGLLGGAERVYTWNDEGSEATWRETYLPGDIRTSSVTYVAAPGRTRLPVLAATRRESGYVTARREYLHEDARIIRDDFIAADATVVTRTYEYDSSALLGRIAAEYYLDEAEGAEVVDETVLRRDERGRLIRSELSRDGGWLDAVDYRVDDEGLPVRAVHETGAIAEIGYLGTECTAAVATWRLGWPDPEEP